jgi:hypothetical protein
VLLLLVLLLAAVPGHVVKALLLLPLRQATHSKLLLMLVLRLSTAYPLTAAAVMVRGSCKPYKAGLSGAISRSARAEENVATWQQALWPM